MDTVDFTSHRRRRWPWVVAALLTLVVVLALLFDWNWLKGPIERRVSAATGRDFSIGGDIDVDLGLRPKVRAQDLHLSNAKWSDAKEMAAVDVLEFRVALGPLFRGRIDIPYLYLQKPRLLIERNEAGRGNWQFSDEPVKPSEHPPLIHELTVDNGEMRVHEPVLKTDLQVKIRSGERTSKQARSPLLAAGEGSYRGEPFELSGRIDSPLDLRHSEEPFHADVRVRAGETKVHATGATLAPLQFENFDLQFEMAGANLADLYRLTDIPLPDTPPYELKGRLSRDAGVWSYRKFTGKVGDSDMAGDASIDLGSKRPKLTADVVSKKLDFDDLAGLINAPPSVKPGETASAEQRQASAELQARPRILPDKPYDLRKLRIMDADVKFRADQVEAPKLPLEQIVVHAQLDNGVLKLNPLDLHAAGGTIASRVTMDAREASIQTTATADIKRLQLPKLFPKVQLTQSGVGSISGVAALTMQGNSVAYMFASANGDIGIVAGPGRISNLLIELAGLDIAESVKYLFDKEHTVPLRCAYADFKVEDGVMTARSMAFDTTDTVIYGQGKIDLRNEKLDLRLIPRPKDVSPLAVRVPLRIGGSLKDPSFLPEGKSLLLRGAAATALYAIAPPAALLALIETGPGENIDCGPSGS